jgi:peroxiredoxin
MIRGAFARGVLALVAPLGCGGAASTGLQPLWERPGLFGAIRPDMGPPQPGDPSPDFELASDAGSFRLSSLRGQWTLLHFTASWCPYCDAEVAHLGEVADAYAKQGVRVVLVGVEEEPGHWKEYAASHVARSIVVLGDTDGAASRKFAPPRAQPSFDDRAQVVLDSTLILDPQGIVRLFLFPDSKHFDPTFRGVRSELERFLAGGVASPPAEATGHVSAESVVTIEARAPRRVAAGETGEISVVLDIAPGYHVMSDHPSDPSLIATRVRFDDVAGVRCKEARYPPAVAFRVDHDSIATFLGKTVVTIPFVVEPDAGPASRTVEGSVRYQACTEGRCLFPVIRRVATMIDVGPPSP